MYNLFIEAPSFWIYTDTAPYWISSLFPYFQFVELHGDRAGYDDPAIVTGIGSMDGRTYMFMGHQKGRNTKENIQRNFGMPTPHGYVQ